MNVQSHCNHNEPYNKHLPTDKKENQQKRSLMYTPTAPKAGGLGHIDEQTRTQQKLNHCTH